MQDSGRVSTFSVAKAAEEGLGGFVRSRRLELGFTLRGFAQHIGVSPAYLSQIEHGKKTWPQKYVSNIAAGLGISQHDLAVIAGLIEDERGEAAA